MNSSSAPSTLRSSLKQKVSQKNNKCEPTKENTVNRKIAIAFVLMLAFAILLSYAAARFPVLPFDLKSYEELQEQASPLFDRLMKGVSDLGELAIAMALTAIAMADLCNTAPMARGDLYACDNQQRTAGFCAEGAHP